MSPFLFCGAKVMVTKRCPRDESSSSEGNSIKVLRTSLLDQKTNCSIQRNPCTQQERSFIESPALLVTEVMEDCSTI